MSVMINSSMHRAEIGKSVLTHFQTDISDAAMSVQGLTYKKLTLLNFLLAKRKVENFL